jgi:hypothetical protein
MSAVQVFYRAASLLMRLFSSLIGIFELSYVDVRDWWDYPSFYPKCQQLKAGAADLNLPPAPP